MAVETFTVLVQQVAKVSFDPGQLTANAALALSDDGRMVTTPEDLARWETTRRNNPPLSHPVVRTHPVSGRKALFVNEGFTTRINELNEQESEALLKLLFAHATRPEFTIRWRWQENDVAFWDNRVTQHYAVDDYRPSRRVMHRATILGDAPF